MKVLPQINYEKIKDVTSEDKKMIGLIGRRMMSIHGHQDLIGLISDRGNGIPLNELMEKPCSQCGITRNKRGKGRKKLR